jgi:hypothetical protein
VVRWHEGRVATQDSVEVTAPATGQALHDAYWGAIRDLYFGLIRRRGNSVVIGPVELLKFGKPVIGRDAVEWPIEGGLLVGAPGGTWRIETSGGQVVASVEGYRPRLPRPVYAVSHLQVHLLFTRLLLLRVRGGGAPAGMAAPREERIRAAVIDIAFCLTVGRLIGLSRRPRTTVAVVAAYHVVCWSAWGQTLGGLVTRQRVLALDGRRLTPAQSIIRLVVAPVAVVLRGPIHEELSGSMVISEKEKGAASAAP